MTFRRKLFVVAGVFLVGLLLIAVAVNHFVFSSEAVFERISGFKLPGSASIIEHSAVECGPFGSDTYQCIHVRIDAKTIKEWLDSAIWKNGPLVGNYLHAENTIPGSILESDRVHYAIDSRQNGRRGRLIVLDPQSEQAWLLAW